MRLGPFEIDHPFILAPMAGITNSPFRRLMKEKKSAVVISELVSANGIEHQSKRTLDLLRYHESERKVGLQIFGEQADHLVQASQLIERLGADFVDLNLGCPVPKVVKKGAGSAMCRNPAELGKILKKMVESVKIPVTIKIRTGWDANSKNVLDVVRVAEESGVAWVAIHGRTRAQGYSGEADWDLIGDVKAKSKLPIIGNGDVTTAEIAVERYRTYGVDGVMIGRGALRNPFIFEQAVALLNGESYSRPGSQAFIDLLDQQRKYLQELYDEKGVMIHARKFLSWYAAGYPGCHEFRRKVFSNPDPNALWEESKAFFLEKTKHRDESFLAQPFLMGGHG